MSDQTQHLIESTKADAKSGDYQALAKLLTALEREGPQTLGLHSDLIYPSKLSFRVGITGPPGAGKSTLISKLITEIRAKDLSVGVIAVDPSSPFSQGAILGDRIRYTEHFNDSKVFIRSLGSRGSLGGLSASAYLMVRAFDLAEFDYVLIETVGVGQTELEIMNVADFVSVVLVPESGDSIQAMKAGLLEIADLFIVNKFDRPGADSFKNELELSLHLDPAPGAVQTPVMAMTALKAQGIGEFLSHLETHKNLEVWKKDRLDLKRIRSEAQALIRNQMERKITEMTSQIQNLEQLAELLSKAF
jgi:LAO/AO transport system kinase